MAVKIDQKIKGYTVLSAEDKAREAMPVASVTRDALEADLPRADVIQMHERIERPEVLIGSTYKIKSPLVEHAMYVTINDIVLNAGSEHEQRRPFEVFINSKSMDHFQWIVALTRIMSAVFRKGGDVTFIVDEMKAVFDPKGGYFKAGGVYMPSLVAELGAIVEDHLKSIGLMHDPEMSDATRALINEKRMAFAKLGSKKNSDLSSAPSSAPAGEGRDGGALASSAEPQGSHEDIEITGDGVSFPPSATMCHKCNTKALVIMDGCATCLNCGYSKCG
ncbi:MAG: NrdJb [Luteimonas sp.]|nr:NrdJb [Luteimonas sp.]